MTVCTNFASQCAPVVKRRCTDRRNEHGGDVPDQFYDGGGESQAHEYVDGAHQHVRHLFFKPEKVTIVSPVQKTKQSQASCVVLTKIM